jgi:DNA-binding PadR family transcriptional regulator
MSASKVLQGSLPGMILALLARQGRMYGYEMTQAVRTQTAGKLQLTEAALYPTLHRLLEEGVLEVETELVAGRPRKYYQIASKGQKTASQRINTLRESLDILQQLLHGKQPLTR